MNCYGCFQDADTCNCPKFTRFKEDADILKAFHTKRTGKVWEEVYIMHRKLWKVFNTGRFPDTERRNEHELY